MATQAQRREKTKTAILDAARNLFIERGFANTSISDILDAAGVSRGALYHHFPGKDAVFEAVFVRTSASAIERATNRPGADVSMLDSLISGCLAWIDIATQPNVARILFSEGPRALGWERCRELEDRTSLHVVRHGLRSAARRGEIASRDIEVSALLINAMLAEAALAIHHHRPGASKAATRRAVTALINGLRP